VVAHKVAVPVALTVMLEEPARLMAEMAQADPHTPAAVVAEPEQMAKLHLIQIMPVMVAMDLVLVFQEHQKHMPVVVVVVCALVVQREPAVQAAAAMVVLAKGTEVLLAQQIQAEDLAAALVMEAQQQAKVVLEL
jgi:hypothetical protein